MTLNVPVKQNHPLAIAQMEVYGEMYFLKAEEVNAIVTAIRALQEKNLKLNWKRDSWD